MNVRFKWGRSMNILSRTIMLGLVLFAVCCSGQGKSSVKPPRTDLHVAVIQGNLKAVKQHIAAGSNLNVKDPNAGSTPLISAATFGKTEVARVLIDAGVDLNMKNNDGSTALLTAAFFCRRDIVILLLGKGADKTLTNHDGATALSSVTAPYAHVKPIYAYIEKALSPLGFQLDYQRIENMRPEIAALLQ